MKFKNIISAKHSSQEKQRICWHDRKPFETLSYDRKHVRMKEVIVKPCMCICNKRPPDDLHNLSGNYTNNVSDWIWLCRKCHCRFHAQKPYFPKDVDLKNIGEILNILGL